MWIFTPVGFFSIVKSTRAEGELMVRARFKKDLDKLRDKYVPTLSPTISEGTDYPHRAFVEQAAFARAMQFMVLDIDYPNFKDRISAEDKGRAHTYMDVWLTMAQAGDVPSGGRRGRKANKSKGFAITNTNGFVRKSG